mmetsp:Transcript_6211/g.11591  ORF Transcript_6211/g.11591 Transcript_6211/m.11591 type:complete len:309 (+) Transcript_6211:3299-4225(+)
MVAASTVTPSVPILLPSTWRVSICGHKRKRMATSSIHLAVIPVFEISKYLKVDRSLKLSRIGFVPSSPRWLFDKLTVINETCSKLSPSLVACSAVIMLFSRSNSIKVLFLVSAGPNSTTASPNKLLARLRAWRVVFAFKTSAKALPPATLISFRDTLTCWSVVFTRSISTSAVAPASRNRFPDMLSFLRRLLWASASAIAAAPVLRILLFPRIMDCNVVLCCNMEAMAMAPESLMLLSERSKISTLRFCLRPCIRTMTPSSDMLFPESPKIRTISVEHKPSAIVLPSVGPNRRFSKSTVGCIHSSSSK